MLQLPGDESASETESCALDCPAKDRTCAASTCCGPSKQVNEVDNDPTAIATVTAVATTSTATPPTPTPTPTHTVNSLSVAIDSIPNIDGITLEHVTSHI